MTGLQFHALTVRDKHADTDDACVVGFDVPADLAATYRFEPGQWLTLRAVLQGEEVRRSYSICAAPGERLRVGVRRVPGGVFSNWLHDHLQPGDRIDVLPPQGRFGAALAPIGQQTRPRHVLLVAGGSGITPMLSLLKTLLGHGGRTRCTLLYGNRSAASTMFKEEIEDLKNRHLTRLAVHPVFSREQVDTPLQAGHIDAEKLYAVLLLAGPVDAVFVCGPHAMNDAVEAALLAPAWRRNASTSNASACRRQWPRGRRCRSRATWARRASASCATGSRANWPTVRRTPTSWPQPRGPAWTCRIRAARACAPPAAPSCWTAACAWTARLRWSRPTSRPASC